MCVFFSSDSHRAALAEAKWVVLCQDCESKLRDQGAALEARAAQLQFSVIQATKSATLGASLLICPDLHTSTVYPSRTTTLMASVDVSRMNTPPTSVWDPMHAPGVVFTADAHQYVYRDTGPKRLLKKW